MFLQRLGNLLTGRGWTTDEEEEEKKRRQSAPTPAKAAPTRAAQQQSQSFTDRALFGQDPQEQGALPPPLQLRQVETLKPQKKAKSISKEDQAVVQKLRERGRADAAEEYLATIQEREDIPRMSIFDALSEVPKAVGTVGRVLGSAVVDETLDMGSRVVEFGDTALTSLKQNRMMNDPGLSPAQRAKLLKKDADRLKGYDYFREGVGDITNKLAGTDISSRENTDRLQDTISSGTASPLDYGWAALQSTFLGGAGVKSGVTAARTAARTVAAGPMTRQATDMLQNSLGRIFSDAERTALATGTTPPNLVGEVASIGHGISTPSMVSKAEADIAKVAQTAQAEAVAAAPRPSLMDSFYSRMNEAPLIPAGRAGEAGFAKVPSKAAPNEIPGPTPEDLAKIEAEMAGEAPIQLPSKLGPAPSSGEVVVTKPAVRTVDEGLAELGLPASKPKKAPKQAPIVEEAVESVPPTAVVPESAAPSGVTLDEIENAPTIQVDANGSFVKEVTPPKAVKEAVTAKPVKPIKNPEVRAVKEAAAQKETMKTAVKEQAKVQKKVRKAVAFATGNEDETIKAAPKLAKAAAKVFTDDPDMARTAEALGARRGEANFTKTTVDAIKNVGKQSDKQALDNAMRGDFGMGDNVKPYEQLIYAAEAYIPRLSRMREAAKTPAEIKKVVAAFDNVVERITALSSSSGTTNSATGYIYKNASPELLHVRSKQKFEKLGGVMDAAEDERLLKTQTNVYTAQKTLDTTNDAQADLLDNFGKKKVTDKQINDLEAQRAANEKELEKALTENERVAGEIFERNLKAGNIVDKDEGKSFGSAYEGWRKAAMLSAPSGRARDVVASGVAIADKVAVDTVEAALGKVFGGSNKSIRRSMAIDPKTAMKGFREGLENLRQIANGEKKGGIYIDAGPEGLDRKYKGAKTDISAAPKKSNKVVRGINAASAAGTELYRGYRTNRLLQYADTAGRQAGYKGKKLQQYKKLYAINPPKAIDEAVEQDFLISSSMHKNPVYDAIEGIDRRLRGWATDPNATPNQRRRRNVVAREASLLTAPFKKYMAGSVHRLATDQNVIHNAGGLIKAVALRDRQRAITHASRLTVNSAKLATVTASIMPFLSDTDGNGKDYSPPYVHIGDNYIPLSSLGPVFAAPIGNSWSVKKAMENYGENENGLRAAAEYGYKYGMIMLQSTGMDSVAAGDSPLMRLGTGFTNGQREEEGANVILRTGGRLMQDITTQWVPAASRDLNSVIDGMLEHFSGETQYAPETNMKDADGNKDYVKSSLMTTLSALPGVRQWMAENNPSTKAAATFGTRLLGASRAGEASKQAMTDEQTEESIKANAIQTSSDRVSKFYGNEKITSVFDDETKLLYEQSQDPKRAKDLKESDYDKIESAVKKGEEKFLYDSDYDTYLLSAENRREKVAADPSTSKKDLESIDWDINVAKTLNSKTINGEKIPYDFYNMYAGSSKSGNDAGNKAGITVSELKDMMDIDSDLYDPDTAEALLQIDQMMAEAGLSDHSKSVKLPKYESLLEGGSKARKAAAKKGRGGGGGGGSFGAPNIGSVSKKTLGPGGNNLQYRDLAVYSSPVPNLSKQTARTNFKKNITIKRGVAL